MAQEKESIDSTNPLYMHPSESVGSGITPGTLNGSGYRSWRRGMLRALSVKNKMGFDSEDMYDQTNGAKLYQIQKVVSDLSQGSMDITTYSTKMKRLWEELGTLDNNNQCNCVCICGAKTAMHKAEQDRRLIQFLMRLNEVYTVVRGSILMMNPLPTIAQVQDKLQSKHCREQQFHRGSSSGIRMFYDYCKRPGHIKDKCYRLHGFPPNFKFTKGKNTTFVAAVLGESNEALDNHLDEPCTLRTYGNLTLTKEQQTQLLHLLGSFQSGSPCTSSDNITSGAANFVAILACSTHSEVIDNLSDKFSLPNGYRVKVTEIGDVVLSPTLTLHKVLFAPSFKFNLISIHSLTVHLLKSDVNFSASSCVLQAPSLKRPLEIGKARNGLYFLCAKCQSSASHCSSFTSLTATSSPSINSCNPNYVCDISEPNALCDISVSQAHSPSPIPSVNTCSSHNKEACSFHDSSLINCSSSSKSGFFVA
ncbi:uncharacterized protein [Solanum tuberosum]|uniref:uncharacterized protein n=1 Tax=Solanum tuberosum TaxID=4113 RepID=UPI00073A0C39|nr:PREDICTED: uncharacterized protein LOC107059772 [Solanum tuberosum]